MIQKSGLALRYPGLSIPGCEHLLPKADHSIQDARFAIPSGATPIPIGATAIPNSQPALPERENAIQPQTRHLACAADAAGNVVVGRTRNRQWRHRTGLHRRRGRASPSCGEHADVAVGRGDMLNHPGPRSRFPVPATLICDRIRGAHDGGRIAGTSSRSGLPCPHIRVNRAKSSRCISIYPDAIHGPRSAIPFPENLLPNSGTAIPEISPFVPCIGPPQTCSY